MHHTHVRKVLLCAVFRAARRDLCSAESPRTGGRQRQRIQPQTAAQMGTGRSMPLCARQPIMCGSLSACSQQEQPKQQLRPSRRPTLTLRTRTRARPALRAASRAAVGGQREMGRVMVVKGAVRMS